jgi:hypothetical protein
MAQIGFGVPGFGVQIGGGPYYGGYGYGGWGYGGGLYYGGYGYAAPYYGAIAGMSTTMSRSWCSDGCTADTTRQSSAVGSIVSGL